MKFAAHALTWRSADVFDVEITEEYASMHTLSYRYKADEGSHWITLILPDESCKKVIIPMSCYKLLKKSAELGLSRLWADCIESELLGNDLKGKMDMVNSVGEIYANATTLPYVALWDDPAYFDRAWIAQEFGFGNCIMSMSEVKVPATTSALLQHLGWCRAPGNQPAMLETVVEVLSALVAGTLDEESVRKQLNRLTHTKQNAICSVAVQGREVVFTGRGAITVRADLEALYECKAKADTLESLHGVCATHSSALPVQLREQVSRFALCLLQQSESVEELASTCAELSQRSRSVDWDVSSIEQLSADTAALTISFAGSSMRYSGSEIVELGEALCSSRLKTSFHHFLRTGKLFKLTRGALEIIKRRAGAVSFLTSAVLLPRASHLPRLAHQTQAVQSYLAGSLAVEKDRFMASFGVFNARFPEHKAERSRVERFILDTVLELGRLETRIVATDGVWGELRRVLGGCAVASVVQTRGEEERRTVASRAGDRCVLWSTGEWDRVHGRGSYSALKALEPEVGWSSSGQFGSRLTITAHAPQAPHSSALTAHCAKGPSSPASFHAIKPSFGSPAPKLSFGSPYNR